MLGRQANTPALIMFYLARARSEDSGEYAQSTWDSETDINQVYEKRSWLNEYTDAIC